MRIFRFILLLWVGLSFLLPPSAHGTQDIAPLPGDSLYQLRSSWTDQDGRTSSLLRFRGKPLVLAMIYTRCRAACPLIVSDMRKIEASLPEKIRPQVQFALFSFDSDGETAESLAQYAKAQGLNPSRWTILRSDAKSVRELAAALAVRYKKTNDGQYTHSSAITILDSSGVPRFRQDKIGGDPREALRIILWVKSEKD